jgi:hypothetical protein
MEQNPTYELARPAVSAVSLPSAEQWNTITSIAGVIGRANNMSADKMANILLQGHYLGLTIPASIELIQSFAGKTSLAPRGALALVHNSPVIKRVDIKRLTDEKGAFVGYSCTIERQNGFSYTARWTMDDAKRAGLVKPDSGWVKYPENMCLYRAVGFACDVAASDVTCGLTAFLKQPEAYGLGIDDGGNVEIIQGTARTVTPAPVDPLPAEIERLCNQYGADAVLEVNNGNIPATLDECGVVEIKLMEKSDTTTKASF